MQLTSSDYSCSIERLNMSHHKWSWLITICKQWAPSFLHTSYFGIFTKTTKPSAISYPNSNLTHWKSQLHSCIFLFWNFNTDLFPNNRTHTHRDRVCRKKWRKKRTHPRQLHWAKEEEEEVKIPRIPLNLLRVLQILRLGRSALSLLFFIICCIFGFLFGICLLFGFISFYSCFF